MLKEDALRYIENLKWLKGFDNTKIGAKSVAEILDEIAEMINDGWVSVKDRMPGDQDIVIIAINDDSGDTPYKYAYFGWYMSEAKCWIVDDEIRRGEVYAWMPLPEPPEVDK